MIPATIFFMAWYLGFVLLAGYAPDFMGESVYQGLTVGYCLAMSQFVMVLVLGVWYLRKAENVFDPLAERAARREVETAEDDSGPARFSTGADDVAASTEGGAQGMTVLAIADGVNALALVVFGIVLAITLLITYWASKRTHSATEFWAANRGISSLQNGFAIAGDYLSASTFLGFAGLIFLFGVDGWVGLAAAGASFLPVVLLLAERMRNAGKFTMADVLAFRLRERPARIAAALGTLVVSFVYLIAQMVGAGVLLQALAGLDFAIAVTITGVFMLVYVIFGGMLATTWVQIIKAGLLMIAGTVLTILVLSKAGFNPFELFSRASDNYPDGDKYLASGLQHPNAINSISFGLALLLGTAGLPHLLMRFFTVPDAKAARGSIAWGVLLIGLFFTMTMLVGVGARAILGDMSAADTAGRQPRDAAARGVARRGRGLGRRRPVPRDHQRAWRSRRSSRSSPVSSSRPPAPWPTTCGAA